MILSCAGEILFFIFWDFSGSAVTLFWQSGKLQHAWIHVCDFRAANLWSLLVNAGVRALYLGPRCLQHEEMWEATAQRGSHLTQLVAFSVP